MDVKQTISVHLGTNQSIVNLVDLKQDINQTIYIQLRTSQFSWFIVGWHPTLEI